jgi:hypothetical protein
MSASPWNRLATLGTGWGRECIDSIVSGWDAHNLAESQTDVKLCGIEIAD